MPSKPRENRRMKYSLALQMINKLCEKTKGVVYISNNLIYDISTIRENCCNRKNRKQIIRSRTPASISDLSHRVKVMAKPFFTFASHSKDPDRLNPIDAMRIKTI